MKSPGDRACSRNSSPTRSIAVMPMPSLTSTVRTCGSLRRLAQLGRLKIPPKVHTELREGTDRLGQRLERLSRFNVIVQLDHQALTHLSRIERAYGSPFHLGGITYPGFWNSPGGRKSADSQVVALAKSRGWVVISNDRSVHGACLLEAIVCRHWDALALELFRL
jgi:hypothetical protein